jgi:hypothetical protein
MILLKLKLRPRSARLGTLKRRYHLTAEDVDEEFGVRQVAPGVYAVRVSDAAAKVIVKADATAQVQSDPTVGPFIRRRRSGTQEAPRVAARPPAAV